jgi:hypothetical protein
LKFPPQKVPNDNTVQMIERDNQLAVHRFEPKPSRPCNSFAIKKREIRRIDPSQKSKQSSPKRFGSSRGAVDESRVEPRFPTAPKFRRPF